MFRVPELLFKPSLIGYEEEFYKGIHELIFQSIIKSDIYYRKDL